MRARAADDVKIKISDPAGAAANVIMINCKLCEGYVHALANMYSSSVSTESGRPKDP